MNRSALRGSSVREHIGNEGNPGELNNNKMERMSVVSQNLNNSLMKARSNQRSNSIVETAKGNQDNYKQVSKIINKNLEKIKDLLKAADKAR